MLRKSAIIIVLSIPSLAYAGGPRFIDGTTPVRYENPNVVLNFDVGTLGSRTNAESNNFVLQSMALWNDVNTSTLNLSQGDNLSSDIDQTNYQHLVFPTPLSSTHLSFSDGLNPVIYDNDGQILDDYLGVGNGNLVGGIASSIFQSGTGHYVTGQAIINGKSSIGGITITDARLSQTITHELAHLIGLDHSQLNISDSNKDCGLSGESYPMMYPTFCSRPTNSLHPDDIAAVSALYPSANVTTTMGEINGLFAEGSNVFPGVNIYVVNTDTGDVYSVVSDYLKQGTGFFSILLPAGTYTLHASHVIAEFNGLSSVGPFATNATDTSFSYGSIATDFVGSTAGSNERLEIITGEATSVNFTFNGSGSFTTGNAMTIGSGSGGGDGSGGGGGDGGGGSLGRMLVCLLLPLFLRRKFKT